MTYLVKFFCFLVERIELVVAVGWHVLRRIRIPEGGDFVFQSGPLGARGPKQRGG